ncbi:hypothetical protein TcWFU_002054 [Taenia crassiceps]|uniref:Uncharacterized protein n=1 Tax=Taenia crassiceps TaxID=6207 RepID=A0ABR4QGK2_9CEST
MLQHQRRPPSAFLLSSPTQMLECQFKKLCVRGGARLTSPPTFLHHSSFKPEVKLATPLIYQSESRRTPISIASVQ